MARQAIPGDACPRDRRDEGEPRALRGRSTFEAACGLGRAGASTSRPDADAGHARPLLVTRRGDGGSPSQ